MSRKWLPGEFPEPLSEGPIKPLRKVKPAQPAGLEELMEALTAASTALINGAQGKAAENALAELRGRITFCRAQWGLDSQRMAVIAKEAQMKLEMKYNTPVRTADHRAREQRRTRQRDVYRDDAWF